MKSKKPRPLISNLARATPLPEALTEYLLPERQKETSQTSPKIFVEDMKSLLRQPYRSKSRGQLVKLLALKYNVDPSTVRLWLRDFVAYGPRSLSKTVVRQDYGEFRLSENTLRLVISLIRRYPTKSSRQLAELLAQHYPEVAAKRKGARRGKPISSASILRIKNAYLAEQGYTLTRKRSSSSLKGL